MREPRVRLHRSVFKIALSVLAALALSPFLAMAAGMAIVIAWPVLLMGPFFCSSGGSAPPSEVPRWAFGGMRYTEVTRPRRRAVRIRRDCEGRACAHVAGSEAFPAYAHPQSAPASNELGAGSPQTVVGNPARQAPVFVCPASHDVRHVYVSSPTWKTVPPM